MSVVAKRIGINSPRAFNLFNVFYLGAEFDASPIYSTFQMTISISGTYSDGTYDYDYDYTGTKTWDREEIRGDGGGNNVVSVDINGILEIPIAAYTSPRAVSDDKFTMALFPALDMNPSPYPLFDPAKPIGRFVLGNGALIEASAIIGTRTNIATTVVEDITANISSGVPTFSIYFTTPTDPRFLVDGFECTAGADVGDFNATISEDATGWAASKWRDFRGTYTATNTDANGITTDIELALG